ncbi:hypothetical protein CXB51_029924 [Gossypium anomalum]|uniref:Uncharacterized protein n=1 Tax=Gossypium anomalum TaxID=47600 RepID=A0A8J5YG01_9ROSI|nr:hypothetical protein CXB51_029924 [Gossypium anomalum]
MITDLRFRDNASNSIPALVISSSSPQKLTPILLAMSFCSLAILISLDTVVQITILNLPIPSTSRLFIHFIMLVFPTPPIPQTPICRTSSSIKHCQISSSQAFAPSPEKVVFDKTCPIH